MRQKLPDIPKIRVRISKDLNNMVVSGTDMKRMIYPIKDVRTYSGKKSVKFNCQNPVLGKKDKTKPILLASFASKTGLISLDGEKYQGKLFVMTSPQLDSCEVINEISLEYYLDSLLTKEMNGNWPIEALKAQAVAARSYALFKMMVNKTGQTFFDLESSERDQVSGSFFDSTANTLKATVETKGEILITQTGNLTPIFYHAQCGGGKTLLPSQVWGTEVEGYRSVPCVYSERENGKGNWQSKFPLRKFIQFLEWAARQQNLSGAQESLAANQKELMVAPDRVVNNKLRIYLGDKVYLVEKALMRRFFNREMFPSNHFVLSLNKKTVEVKGVGLGHGVGMPQLGAKTMAERGWNYKQILSYYFPVHKLKKIY
ncbi:MAG: SpoIID/LytB domain-containing protein [Pseudomonadota bacterium]